MAEIQISYINPIRFRPNVVADDLPRIDKMKNQVQYYKGVYPLENYTPDWLLGQTIVIQMQITLPFPFSMVAVAPSGTTNVVAVDVTPSGWTGQNVLNYSYTPTEIGEHYFYTIAGSSVDNEFISDVFNVRSNDYDLVEIKYSDTDNRFDGVFYDGTTQIWSPKAYFTGISMPGKPKSESSIYTDDQSTPVRTKGTTQRTIDVKFTDITINHYSQLIDIFTCDTNYINNQPSIMVDEFDSEGIEKSDGCDVSLNMIRVEDNNFIKNY